MQKQFDILLQSRKLILKVLENKSASQMNEIPTGFKNNLIWNLAHLTVTQQLLCYNLSGLDCLVSNDMIQNFQKGTSPSYFVSKEEIEQIKEQFITFPKRLETDYTNEIFKNFTPYTTSVTITLNNIADAVSFNNYHEGIHLGIILQLIKFI